MEQIEAYLEPDIRSLMDDPDPPLKRVTDTAVAVDVVLERLLLNDVRTHKRLHMSLGHGWSCRIAHDSSKGILRGEWGNFPMWRPTDDHHVINV